MRRLPVTQWHALIREAHPAHVSWEEHEQIEAQLAASTTSLVRERQVPAREGSALLQGRVVCGLCGSRMPVHYNVRGNGQQVPNYVCFSRGRLFGAPSCLSVLATQIDAAVGKLLVETITPMVLELALAIEQEIVARVAEAERLRHQHVERAQCEADHARLRYMQVDVANRLVADSLEADWNDKLLALAIEDITLIKEQLVTAAF